VPLKKDARNRICQICGKGPHRGRSIVRRGLAKKVGGVGRKITGITARSFRPNIQKIRIRYEGKVVRARVCASCIKRGRVTKAISRTRKPA
jgi:large subunit ribosomal protein L28